MGLFRTKEERARARFLKAISKHDLHHMAVIYNSGLLGENFGYDALDAARGWEDGMHWILARKNELSITQEELDRILERSLSYSGIKSSEIMLQHGAVMSEEMGRDFLFDAAYWGNGDKINWILSKGIDVTLKNSRMETAAHVARKEKYAGIADFLDQKIAEKTGAKLLPEPVQKQFVTVSADEWLQTGDTEVTHVTLKPGTDYRVTEIFNFAAQTYIVITHNLATKIDTTPILREFEDFKNPAVLEIAEEKFIEYAPEQARKYPLKPDVKTINKN